MTSWKPTRLGIRKYQGSNCIDKYEVPFHLTLVNMEHVLAHVKEPHLTQSLKHAQDCLSQCLDIHKTSQSDASVTYPLILKSSTCHTTRVSPSPPSPPLSLHPSTLSTFTSRPPLEPTRSSTCINSRYAPSLSSRSSIRPHPIRSTQSEASRRNGSHS